MTDCSAESRPSASETGYSGAGKRILGAVAGTAGGEVGVNTEFLAITTELGL